MSSGESAPPPDPPSLNSPPRRIVGGVRFLTTFFLANAGMYAVFQGMQQIILPTQVADIDPDGKVVAYGVLASIGALTAAVGNPIFGAMSDRTNSRLGRRTPWLIVSAIVAVVLLAVLGGMASLFWLATAYIAVMLAMSAFQAVISALIPDRVPTARRGLASSVASASMTLGVIYGLNVAPVFVETPVLAYLAVGALLIVGTLLLAVLAPDPTAQRKGSGEAKRPGTAKLLFSALRDHDFALAFGARATFMIGHWTISTYQLYTVTDYIGVQNVPGGNAAGAVAVLATLKLTVALITALVAGPLSDKFARRKIFVIVASFGVAAGICIPLIWPTWVGMLAYAVVVGFFYGAYLAVDHAIMTLVLPQAKDNARDLGLLNIATTGPQIAGPFIAAVVITVTGGYAALFAFAAVVAALSAFLIAPIRKVR